jgi:hypothetical protein
VHIPHVNTGIVEQSEENALCCMERVRFHPLSVSRFALNVERHLIAECMSETLRPKPSANLLIWMRSEPVSSLFTTTITKAELLYGVALLAPGKR